MFEARFQSFDDPQRARAERAARCRRCARNWRGAGCRGLILPRADRHQNEYVPPSEERLAWLTGFTGSAGDGDRARRARRAVRRRPLHACRRASQVDACGVHDRAIWSTTPPRALARAEPAGRRQARLRPVAAHRRRRRAAGAGLRQRRRDAGRRSSPIRSTRSGPTGRRRRSGRWCCTICASPAKTPSAKLDSIRAEIGKPARRRAGGVRPARRGLDLQHPRLRRRHTPLPLAFAIVPKEGRPALYIDGAQARQRGAPQARGDSPRCASPRTSSRDLAGARQGATHRAARPGDRRRCAVAHHRRGRRQGDARRRSDRDDEGGEEPGRDRGRARGACARRRGGDALPRLVRPRGAERASSPRSTRSRRWKASAATPACSRTCRSRPSPAPGPTAPSCTTA